MKKLLLSAALLTAAFGYSQTFDNIPTGTGFYINKSIPSPSTNDQVFEYYEFRGTPNAVVPSDLYFISIEGDGEDVDTKMGRVEEAIQLGDGVRTFGANGILAIVANHTDSGTSTVTTNPYTSVISSDATIITIEIVGTNINSGSSSSITSVTPDIGYDALMNDQSSTYMLVSAPSNPDNVDIDSDNDGAIDASGDHTLWTLYDSYSVLDDDDYIGTLGSGQTVADTGEFGYGQIIFAANYTGNEANYLTTPSANVISTSDDFQMNMRQGMSTGFTAADWVGARVNSSSSLPNWTFSGTHVSPAAFAGYTMSNDIFGDLNPTEATLSTPSNTINGSSIGAGPVPMQETLTISGVEVDSSKIYSVGGVLVATGGQTVDVAGLSSGFYVLEVTSGGKTATTTVVK